jgi:hypothetical protein
LEKVMTSLAHRDASGRGLLFGAGLAEVVDRNVKYGEEGVPKSSMRSRFLSLRDWVAS